MATVKNRIIKKRWHDFFQGFNSRMKFMTFRVMQDDEEICNPFTLAGILYSDDTNSVTVIAAEYEPDIPCRQAAKTDKLRFVYEIADKEKGDMCGVQVQDVSKQRIRLELSDDNADRNRHIWISHLAQKIYERRAAEEADGSAQEDWLKAESIVEQSIASLNDCI